MQSVPVHIWVTSRQRSNAMQGKPVQLSATALASNGGDKLHQIVLLVEPKEASRMDRAIRDGKGMRFTKYEPDVSGEGIGRFFKGIGRKIKKAFTSKTGRAVTGVLADVGKKIAPMVVQGAVTGLTAYAGAPGAAPITGQIAGQATKSLVGGRVRAQRPQMIVAGSGFGSVLKSAAKSVAKKAAPVLIKEGLSRAGVPGPLAGLAAGVAADQIKGAGLRKPRGRKPMAMVMASASSEFMPSHAVVKKPQSFRPTSSTLINGIAEAPANRYSVLGKGITNYGRGITNYGR